MRKIKTLAAAVACVAISAHASPLGFPQHIPLDYLPIYKIRLGMTQTEVEKILGEKIYPKAGVALVINPLQGEGSTDHMMSGLDFGKQGKLVQMQIPARRGTTFEVAFAALTSLGTPYKLDRTSTDFIAVPAHLISEQHLVCLEKNVSVILRSERYNPSQQVKLSWDMRKKPNPASLCK